MVTSLSIVLVTHVPQNDRSKKYLFFLLLPYKIWLECISIGHLIRSCVWIRTIDSTRFYLANAQKSQMVDISEPFIASTIPALFYPPRVLISSEIEIRTSANNPVAIGASLQRRVWFHHLCYWVLLGCS